MIEQAQVVEAEGNIRVVRAKGLLIDRQDAPCNRDGLLILALPVQLDNFLI